ncbi:MAG: pyridoxal-phosphate dependent enzyme [Gammaproteobacteria bacterium]
MTKQSHSTEFLQLLNDSLKFAPERGDIWMMRFDAMRALGFKKEFAQALAEGMANPTVKGQLDLTALRGMWGEIAPGEAFPGDPPKPAAPPPAAAGAPAAAKPAPATGATMMTGTHGVARVRRFNDIAVKIAGPELAELARAYNAVALRPSFLEDFTKKTALLLKRPTPLEYSNSVSRAAGEGLRVYLKREDRRGVPVETEHAAAHCYIGSQLGKTSVVTGNDVDAHALAVAEVAPFFKMKCTVVVRPADLKDKPDFIARLKSLGAQVEPMPLDGMLGTDPREGAVRIWQKATTDTHLALSLGMAPAPYTAMANNFQALLGREADTQYTATASLLSRPRTMVAAVGSEADSIGFVLPFLNRREVRVAYAEPEPGGRASWRVSTRLKPYNGQVREHSWLKGVGRIQHVPVSDADAGNYRDRLARDGITVSLEDARAVALTALMAQGDPTPRDFVVLIG